MCLGLPMLVVKCDGLVARCEARGAERTVNLLFLQHEQVQPGDHVMVHAGYARQKMTPADAAAAWALFDEILDFEEPAFDPATAVR